MQASRRSNGVNSGFCFFNFLDSKNCLFPITWQVVDDFLRSKGLKHKMDVEKGSSCNVLENVYKYKLR